MKKGKAPLSIHTIVYDFGQRAAKNSQRENATHTAPPLDPWTVEWKRLLPVHNATVPPMPRVQPAFDFGCGDSFVDIAVRLRAN